MSSPRSWRSSRCVRQPESRANPSRVDSGRLDLITFITFVTFITLITFVTFVTLITFVTPQVGDSIEIKGPMGEYIFNTTVPEGVTKGADAMQATSCNRRVTVTKGHVSVV